jgi:hypothetical protein
VEVRVLSSALQLVSWRPLAFGAPNRHDAAHAGKATRSRIPRSSVLSVMRDPSTILFVRKFILVTLTRAWNNPRLRRVLSFGSIAAAITGLGLTVFHFSKVGFPLDGAEPRLAGVAGAFFVLAYALKAYGWHPALRSTHPPRSCSGRRRGVGQRRGPAAPLRRRGAYRSRPPI